MPPEAASEHLEKWPNSNFVWRRNSGAIAVVQSVPMQYDDVFRAVFRCSELNPDEAIFAPRKVSEFRRAMRGIFGQAADTTPVVYARKTSHNPSLVLIGGKEALLEFLRSRSDIQSAMNILHVSEHGF
eukprot:326719-Prymnesium_polylepis.1